MKFEAKVKAGGTKFGDETFSVQIELGSEFVDEPMRLRLGEYARNDMDVQVSLRETQGQGYHVEVDVVIKSIRDDIKKQMVSIGMSGSTEEFTDDDQYMISRMIADETVVNVTVEPYQPKLTGME